MISHGANIHATGKGHDVAVRQGRAVRRVSTAGLARPLDKKKGMSMHPLMKTMKTTTILALCLPVLAQAGMAAPLAFEPAADHSTGQFPYLVVTNDFNLDTLTDIAVVNNGVWPYSLGSVSVLLGTGDGGFQPATTYTAGVIPMGMASGDFNGDGSPDLFVVNRAPYGTSSLMVFLNRDDGSGTFLPPITMPSGSQPKNVAIGHFNTDAYLDAAVAVHGDSALQILFGTVDGHFVQTYPFIPFSPTVTGVVTGDFNNDGFADLVSSNWGYSNLTILSGHGDGTFTEQPPRPATVSLCWMPAAGDFNGDSRLDIIAPSATTGTASVLLGNGDGSFLPQMVTTVGGNSYLPQLADMNNDGELDLIVASGGLRILAGNGDGTFQPAQFFSAPDAWAGSAVADFNRDGAPDVVVANNPLHTVSVFLQIPPNQAPLANAGGDIAAECLGGLTPVQLDGSLSSDPDNDGLTFSWTVAGGSGATIDNPADPKPTGWFPLGATLVTLTVDDGKGGIDSDDVLVVVSDTTAPVLACTTDPATLWPPNHRMQRVGIALGVIDVCTDADEFTVLCHVTSNEPDDAKGDGKTTGDVNGSNGYMAPVPVALTYDPGSNLFRGVVSLRAERNGGKSGRIYSISCEATDSSGNTSTASCVVIIPHNR